MKFGVEFPHAVTLRSCNIRGNLFNESRTLLKGRARILSVLLAFTVQFVVRDLHTNLSSICESFERRHAKGCTLLMYVSKIKLREYRKSVWNCESKERLGVVPVQRHAVHHLLSRYIVVRCMNMA